MLVLKEVQLILHGILQGNLSAMAPCGNEDSRRRCDCSWSCTGAPGANACAHAQVPYHIEVSSSQYKDILNVYNANLTSNNVTSTGSALFEVRMRSHLGATSVAAHA